MASKKTTKKPTPWEKPAPAKAKHKSLTPGQKKHAAARAKKAGRSYPNLVDNMHEAADAGGTGKKATGGKSAAKKTTKRAPAKKKAASKRAPAKKTTTKRAPAKKSASKRAPAKKKGASKRAPAKKKGAAAYTARKPRASGRAAEKDPKGGLTAAGRRAFRERDGANLKPGVMKPQGQMTPEEMKRKGSWAVRFYGRAGKLPPLVDKQGRPTRLALTAAAWGESVPKTEAAARAIAAKGHRLLERAQKAKA
jgi:hypothetical protein